MPRAAHRLILATLALGLMVAAPIQAVSQGRVFGTVKDENNKPIEGVKVTVTFPGVESYKVEATTNAKGDYAVTLIDATRVYLYTLEKEGYQAIQQELKVPIGANQRQDYQMLSIAEAQRRGPQGRELTPKEKAVLVFNEGAEASQMGDPATAKTKFQEAMTLDPTLVASYSALATLHFGEGDYARAVQLAEQGHAIDARDLKSLRILAEGYAKLGDTEKSRAASAAMSAIDPKAGANEIYNQAIAAYNAGNNDAAVPLLEQALAADAGHAKAHYLLGLCLAGTDAGRAKQHFETFLSLAPNDPDAATAREMVQYLK
jgi:tetratricopeptide (TPR) repeat protein